MQGIILHYANQISGKQPQTHATNIQFCKTPSVRSNRAVSHNVCIYYIAPPIKQPSTHIIMCVLVLTMPAGWHR